MCIPIVKYVRRSVGTLYSLVMNHIRLLKQNSSKLNFETLLRTQVWVNVEDCPVCGESYTSRLMQCSTVVNRSTGKSHGRGFNTNRGMQTCALENWDLTGRGKFFFVLFFCFLWIICPSTIQASYFPLLPSSSRCLSSFEIRALQATAVVYYIGGLVPLGSILPRAENIYSWKFIFDY